MKSGHSLREAERRFGYAHQTILNWMKRSPRHYRAVIPTLSSRPHHHPRELPASVVDRILILRRERQQCAEILHHRLLQEGIRISLSSVKRTLKRNGLTRFSQWKKWHQYPERPAPQKPGILVQIDTVMDGPADARRLYVYTGLDVCSRFAFAYPVLHLNTHASGHFVRQMQEQSPFAIELLQSDHGSEFSEWFSKQCLAHGLRHRHSRVRMPTDNAHLERFNLTLQKECLSQIPRSLSSWSKEIPAYLKWYNTQRPHMGLQMKSPLEVVRSY